MQRLGPLTIIFFISALLASGCSSYKIDPSLHTAIVGTWKASSSSELLTIYSDGRFVLEEVPGIDGKLVKGTIERGRDMIMFMYETPSSLCASERGVYNFSREDDTLTLTMVSEECRDRASHLALVWNLENKVPKEY